MLTSEGLQSSLIYLYTCKNIIVNFPYFAVPSQRVGLGGKRDNEKRIRVPGGLAKMLFLLFSPLFFFSPLLAAGCQKVPLPDGQGDARYTADCLV